MKLNPVTNDNVKKVLWMGGSYAVIYGAVDLLVCGRKHVMPILLVSFVGYTLARLAMHVVFGGKWDLDA
jgi:hypothetical protein